MISKTLSLICGLLIVSTAFGTSSKLDSLLKELDRTIPAEKQLMSTKEKRINRLKQLLHSSTSVEAKFNIYGQIFDEYEVYICDSAYHYAQLISELADQHNNKHWANESKLQTVSILTISGMYLEAVDILSLWTHTDLDGGAGGFVNTLAPHSCQIFRLTTTQKRYEAEVASYMGEAHEKAIPISTIVAWLM